MSLFQRFGLSDILRQRLEDARQRVLRMELSELQEPSLAGHLEKLWRSSRSDNFPVLQRASKRGTRRQVSYPTDDYDREVVRNMTVVDVSVPFEGDGQLFHVRPSTCAILNEEIDVSGNYILYTMPLDPSAEPQFEKMLDQIEVNLGRLRSETEQFDKTAVQELLRVADDRRRELEADEKSLSGFSFPIN